MLYPNFLGELYKILKDVYTNKRLFNNIIAENFLKDIISTVGNEDTDEIYRLYDQLIGTFDDFEVERANFNIKTCTGSSKNQQKRQIKRNFAHNIGKKCEG